MKFYRIGSCKRCGKCCQAATLWPDVARLFGIEDLVEDIICPHLKRNSDGTTTCLIYPKRPKLCRDFPAEPADIANLPECGYKFVDERGRVVFDQPRIELR